MEEEYMLDISEDAVETSFENENIQQPQSSLQTNIECTVDMHIQGGGSGGAEGGGDGNGEIEVGLGVINNRGEAIMSCHPDLPPSYNIIGSCSAKKCIFRVPKHTRVIEKTTYTPQTVSIGPYHYGNPKFSRMEFHKKKLLASMRCNPNWQLSLTEAMPTELEASARGCYSTKFKNIDTDTFREMMLTDAAFIIHAFLSFDQWCNSAEPERQVPEGRRVDAVSSSRARGGCAAEARRSQKSQASRKQSTVSEKSQKKRDEEEEKAKHPDDGELQGKPIFQTPWRQVRQPNICEDLLMLENQLPFFILVQVYAILTNESNESSANCLKKLAMQFFKQVEFGKAGGDDSVTVTVADNPKHLLDLFHSSFVVVVEDKSKIRKPKKVTTPSSSPPPMLRVNTKYWVSSASTLRSDGVKFIATKKGNPLDIKFNRYIGRLRIPTLCINDTTVTVLKNLLAYEQGSRLPNPYFTCLAIFFSNLAPTTNDIKLLREADIINHQSADDGEVVLLLQQLYKASQNGFNACLIKHHLQLIDRYLISTQAQVMSFLRKRGGAAKLGYNFVASLSLTLFLTSTERVRV